MKFAVISTAGIFAATASAKPCSNNCRNAIVSDTPASLGEAFCSSFLSIKPLPPVTATVTVVHDEIVTTTHTNSETTTTTVVTTPTTVVATSTLSVFMKRSQSADPVSASILSACNTKSARISRICSSLLPPISAGTSTLTVKQTSTQTTVTEFTTTAVETTTDTVTATSLAIVTQSVQPIRNGGFDDNISPWTDSATTGQTGGYVEYVAEGNICVDTASNCHQSSIIRMTPPVSGDRYVAVSQTFEALPSTTYKLSMLLNSRYAGSSGAPAIQVWYNGVNLGTYECNTPTTELYFKTISVWEFTTDVTGTGLVEVRALNHLGTGGYFYLDDIMVVKT